MRKLSDIRDENASLMQKLSGLQSRCNYSEKLKDQNEALKRKITHLELVVAANSQIGKFILKKAKK